MKHAPRPAIKLLVAGLTLVVGSVALGFSAGSAVKSPAQALADTAAPRPTVLTEAVTYGSVSRSVSFDGAVERQFNFSVSAPAVVGDSAASIVTRLPHRHGDIIKNGSLVAEVSGRPVIVLAGRIPSFRALAPGAEGRDVAQLQAGLRRAGLSISDPRGEYGATTADAVASLYARFGYDAVVVGTEEVEAAELAVRDGERSLAQARESGDKSAIRYAEEDLSRAREDLATARSTAGAQVPAGEIAFVPSLPAEVTQVDSSVGAPAGDSLLTLAAGRFVVRGEPQVADLTGLRPGAHVELLLAPEGRRTGRVSHIAATTQTTDGSTENADLRRVTVVPTKALTARQSGAAARVVVTVAQSPDQGLIVPVSAVVAAADGRTFVTVIDDDGRREVEVTTGFIGNGAVNVAPVQGSGLSKDERVAIGLGG